MLFSLLFLVFLCLSILSIVFSYIKVNTDTHGFLDDSGRELFFHGVNAVYKIAPWVPNTTGFDAKNSLSDIDARNLRTWGFNVVRLGVMWPGIEPTKGSYNSTYMDEIELIVNNLKAENIYVILDFHQDLFHRKFCGEGVPDYVYETCVTNEPKNTKPFPLPVVNTTYPVDSDGNPELDSCLTKGFASYYLSQEVGAGYQCLYENMNGLWDNFANYWIEIAKRFKSYTNVLGYELFNEPWAGNPYEDPKVLFPGYAEKNLLQPMYEYLNKAIRSIDDDHIIFYEGLTIDYWPNGFTSGPGGVSYNDRQALAYHIYCPIANPTATKEFVCDGIQDEFFYMRRKDADRLGGGMMMTEFGASRDVKGDLYALQRNCNQADKFTQSWIYWQFKYYQDLTTSTPVGESLYNDDGTVVDDKVKVLVRTYPQAVDGSDISYSFHPNTATFELKYTLRSEMPDSPTKCRTSQVYFNKQYYYPHGAIVTVTTSSTDGSTTSTSTSSNANDTTDIPVKVSCGLLSNDGLVFIQQTEASNATIIVNLSPCRLDDTSVCTCK